MSAFERMACRIPFARSYSTSAVPQLAARPKLTGLENTTVRQSILNFSERRFLRNVVAVPFCRRADVQKSKSLALLAPHRMPVFKQPQRNQSLRNFRFHIKIHHQGVQTG